MAAPSMFISTTLLCTVLALVLSTSAQDEDDFVQSVCPAVFQYDRTRNEMSRWYGELTINTDFTLHGVWLRFELDRKADLVGNQFGEVKTTDNMLFKIQKRDYVLKPGEPLKIPIFVKYNTLEGPPELTYVRLNARTICSDKPQDVPRISVVSRCPGIYLEDTTQEKQDDRWFGLLIVTSEYELNGLWIKVILDSAAEIVGSKFGEVVTKQNNEFLIKNPEYTLKAGETLRIPFFVKYSEGSTLPNIETIRLNARTICAPYASGTNEVKQITSLNTTPFQTPKFIVAVDTARPVLVPKGASTPSARTPSRPVDLASLFANLKCGLTEPQDRVIAGTPTTILLHPWHGAMHLVDNSRLNYICGLSLVTRLHALTAAHCIYSKSGQLVDITAITVTLGVDNLQQINGPDAQHPKIFEVYKHTGYSYGMPRNDIAVIKFVSEVTFSDKIRPVCLWSQDESLRTVENKNGVVIGFGLTEEGTISNQLLSTENLVVDSDKCKERDIKYYGPILYSTSFCAGNLSKSTVCSGDSGSGMFFLKPGTLAWEIRGIVSTGRVSDRPNTCDTSYYAIFTDVAKYTAWIMDQLQK